MTQSAEGSDFRKTLQFIKRTKTVELQNVFYIQLNVYEDKVNMTSPQKWSRLVNPASSM